MSTLQEKNKAVVIRFNKEFLQDGNLDSFEALLAPDFINHSAATLGIPAGREGIADYILQVLHKVMEDITVEILDQVAEGDTVVTRKTISGTLVQNFMNIPAGHQRVTMHLIDMVKVRNGQYTDHWRYGQVVSIDSGQ
jgi:predicted SnoaL-like aldol condensation-catalyzing enzyme